MVAFVVAIVVLGVFSFFRVRRRLRENAELKASANLASGVRVVVDETGISLVAPAAPQRIAWPDVRTVHIESVAGGLNADDVFWVLTPSAGSVPLRVAQTAPGADTMIARLQQLPGFRYEPMINSMITTEATRFLVWERDGG